MEISKTALEQVEEAEKEVYGFKFNVQSSETSNLKLPEGKGGGGLTRVVPTAESVSAAENETVNFEVATTGIEVSDLVWAWTMSSGDTLAVTATAKGAAYSFASPVAGAYTITCAASGGNPSVSWTLTVAHDYSKSYILDLARPEAEPRMSHAPPLTTQSHATDENPMRSPAALALPSPSSQVACAAGMASQCDNASL